MRKKLLILGILSAVILTGCSNSIISTESVQDNTVDEKNTEENNEIDPEKEIEAATSDIEIDNDLMETDGIAATASLSDDNDYTTSVGEQYIEYEFRNDKLLEDHYEKHGIEMGFGSAEEYESAAADVINNPQAIHKKESEDDDIVYYIEVTNEFAVLSDDGYIRTYFNPSAGKDYYDRQ